MSGGSFNYLYGAETLLGRSEQIGHMAEYVRTLAAGKTAKHVTGEGWVPLTAEERHDLLTAAAELEKLAAWLSHVEHRCDAKQEFYSSLLKSVEWTCSGDTSADNIVDAYRSLLGEKGPT